MVEAKGITYHPEHQLKELDAKARMDINAVNAAMERR